MPNCILARTRNFLIEWWPGADARGLYVTSQTPAPADLEYHSDGTINEGSIPQFFVDRALVSDLIQDLRRDQGPTVLLTRVTSDRFIPGFFRVPKKDGGDPAKAYYNPLPLLDEQRDELADAIEFACSRANVTQLEAANTRDSYSVLDNDYLENGVWASTRLLASYGHNAPQGGAAILTPPAPAARHLPASKLAEAPKNRLPPPSHTSLSRGAGFSLLRVASVRHQCERGSNPHTRGAERCLGYVWIKPDKYYLEHKQGSSTQRYHLACAFRSGVIPTNWLNPHFEQFHILVAQGMEKWIATERAKRADYEADNFHVPSDKERVEAFVTLVRGGYKLDRYEREDWRDHLRHVPIDIEPYQAARALVGLTLIPVSSESNSPG